MAFSEDIGIPNAYITLEWLHSIEKANYELFVIQKILLR